MKGIILAAGNGTRLYPSTYPTSKILLPVYDRPMVYYPLSTLITAGIKDILVIVSERDLEGFKRTLGDGSVYGINIDYMIQYVQRGISDAFIIAKDWIDGEDVVLILGDNIFYGGDTSEKISETVTPVSGAVIFGYMVEDPRRFGVIEFDEKGQVLSLEEKPQNPKSNYAAVGLYFYDEKVCPIAKGLKPSARGELEITDLNNDYLKKGELSVKLFNTDSVWIDTGTFDSLLDASNFIYNEEKRLGKTIMCPELIAYRKGYVSKEKLLEIIEKNKSSDYYKSIGNEL